MNSVNFLFLGWLVFGRNFVLVSRGGGLYIKTCLNWTTTGPNNLSALNRCPVYTGVHFIEVRLFWLILSNIRLIKYIISIHDNAN